MVVRTQTVGGAAEQQLRRGAATAAAGSKAETAKLNYIDFNPDADATTHLPVIIMHGLLGNSKNFKGWGGAWPHDTLRSL